MALYCTTRRTDPNDSNAVNESREGRNNSAEPPFGWWKIVILDVYYIVVLEITGRKLPFISFVEFFEILLFLPCTKLLILATRNFSVVRSELGSKWIQIKNVLSHTPINRLFIFLSLRYILGIINLIPSKIAFFLINFKFKIIILLYLHFYYFKVNLRRQWNLYLRMEVTFPYFPLLSE